MLTESVFYCKQSLIFLSAPSRSKACVRDKKRSREETGRISPPYHSDLHKFYFNFQLAARGYEERRMVARSLTQYHLPLSVRRGFRKAELDNGRIQFL